ncbi:hypothetical protein E1A91_D13G174900v1 [Gossypium mustelinum]|uniref:Uncharacterized protein n=1 Tax=Gossypium mustelinum TaxID=34275 RepID=A0A5D2S4T3_GOSMU|nr:hypothetical protein E1A91_D13G174900v1 [Gossypium mustelinum]
MATTAAAVRRNLLKNSKSLPQILRGQINGRSNVTANLNNVAKDHQVVGSLLVSNQKVHAQMPIFNFPEMGSVFESSRGQSLVGKSVSHGMDGLVFDVRGKGVVQDDDDMDNEFDDDDDEFDDDFEGEFVDDEDDEVDDDDDDDDDGGKYKDKF